MSSTPVRLAISTCPNDTFAFHAILNQKIDLQGLKFQIELLDIQQLNDGLMAGRFDVAKASFYAAIGLANETIILRSGSALGFGVGPLLLAAGEGVKPDSTLDSTSNSTVESEGPKGWLTLCPGELTTATMLFKLFYGSAIASGQTRIQHRVFSEIMPTLQNGRADFGVCIHEGRFTWQDAGLFLVEDLGTRWETETQSPLPLGGILARRSLGAELLERIQSVIRSSIEYGLAHRDETVPTMAQYAQEYDQEVLMRHVDLYVNDWTVDLGDVGRRALQVLGEQAKVCGLAGRGTRELEVL